MSKGPIDQRVNNLERDLAFMRDQLAEVLDRVAQAPGTFRGIITVELNESVSGGGEAECKVLDADSSDDVDSGETIQVHANLNFEGDSGDKAYAFYRETRRRWEFLCMDC